MRTWLIILLCVLLSCAALAVTSCMIKQEATLASDGSGSVSFRFELAPFFHIFLVDMAELSDEAAGLTDGGVFNEDKIKEDFARKPNVELLSLESPEPEILEGTFEFLNIEDVFTAEAQLAQAGVISFSEKDGVKSVRLHLDKENFKQIATFMPGTGSSLIDVFGPEENEDTTEEEYLEMLEFMLGEDGPPGVKASLIELRVKVKGKILEQTGGELDGSSVIFKIPLLKVLLLDQPLDYSLTFK